MKTLKTMYINFITSKSIEFTNVNALYHINFRKRMYIRVLHILARSSNLRSRIG